MPQNESDGVRVTNRDIYDLLEAHITEARQWRDEANKSFTEHVIEDEKRFSRLNVKFYGILVSLALAFGTVVTTGHVKVAG